jgi:rhamnose transport system permease protein
VIGRYRRELSVAAALAALLGLLWIAAPRFYEGDEIRAILVRSAPVLILAVGMALVVLARQIDISVGSVFSVTGVAAGLLARSGIPMAGVVPLTIAAGALLGALNGALVSGLGLPAIVVTLATRSALQESLAWAREGEFVRDLPAGFQWMGLGQEAGRWVLVAAAALFFAAFAWAMRWLAAGRAVRAVGSDAEAARLAGIRPARVVFWVFVLMGALTGLAALLNSVRFPMVDPNAGKGLELQVIAAVVVGGVAISGGRGTPAGVGLGVLLLSSIGSALLFLGIPAPWEKALQGAIILVAVASDAFNLRQRTDARASLASR